MENRVGVCLFPRPMLLVPLAVSCCGGSCRLRVRPEPEEALAEAFAASRPLERFPQDECHAHSGGDKLHSIAEAQLPFHSRAGTATGELTRELFALKSRPH